MSVQSIKTAARVSALTGTRVHLKRWEEIVQIRESENSIQLKIETYEVKELRREDRYENHGYRLIFFLKNPSGRWYVDFDETIWDEDFDPIIWDKRSNPKTAQELEDQREFEQLCYRPGTPQQPLDSYSRVWSDKSTPKMERYW